MTFRQTAAPATEPLTMAEVLAHLRFDASNQEPAPTVITAALGSGAGNVDNGAHRYACTFVTADGETQGGTVSTVVTVADKTVNGKAALSAIPVGGAAVTARKLYRTTAGGSTYLLLATLADNTTTTYSDNIADASLGAGMPSTNTTSDPLLSRLIITAREMCEDVLRRALVTQSWKLTLDRFPGNGWTAWATWGGTGSQYPGFIGPQVMPVTIADQIRLPLPPLQTVESVKYYDTAGTQQTLAVDQYLVDTQSEPGRITPAYNCVWPQVQARINAVEVSYTCGFASAALVPRKWKEWMLMQIGAMERNRETEIVAPRLTQVQLGFVDALLQADRVFML